MRLNKMYLDGALKTLSERREQNKRLENTRRSEILKKIPEYEKLEAELALTMNEVISLALDKSALTEEKVNAAFEKNQAIRQKMNDLFEKNGYPADYLEPIFTCPKCRDKGNTGSEWCECLCRLTNEMAAAELNQNAPLAKSRFDNFDLNRYPDETPKKESVSPREIMRDNFEYCKKFSEDFRGEGSGVLMMGSTGLGKTHLSLGIANVLIKKGFCVVYGSVPELIRKIQDQQFGRADGDILSLATSCDTR